MLSRIYHADYSSLVFVSYVRLSPRNGLTIRSAVITYFEVSCFKIDHPLFVIEEKSEILVVDFVYSAFCGTVRVSIRFIIFCFMISSFCTA